MPFFAHHRSLLPRVVTGALFPCSPQLQSALVSLGSERTPLKITGGMSTHTILKGAVYFVLCRYRFPMHLKEDKKLGRFPFSELKSDHNCARDKLPKMSARQRRERGGGRGPHKTTRRALPSPQLWKLVLGAIMIRFQF